MARHKDVNWNLNDLPDSTTYQDIKCALLMDIRDELKELNRLLHCANFQKFPHTLVQIRRNTTKRKYTRRARRSRPTKGAGK